MVYINIAGNLIPFFINELSLLNNKAVVSFMDVDDTDKASEVLFCTITRQKTQA